MTEPMPLYPNQMEAINSRLASVNKMYASQQTGDAYLDFPDSFPIRGENDVLLGEIKFDDCVTWIFHPCTVKESEQDEQYRKHRVLPPPKF